MSGQQDEVITPDDVQPPGSALVKSTEQQLAEFFDYANSLTAEDDDQVQERILASILAANTAQDILRAGDAIPADDLINVPLMVRNIRVSDSTYEDGMDIYLHVEATKLGSDEQVTFAAGARDIVVKLIAMHMRHLLPVPCVIRKKEKATKAGFFPLFLRVIPPDEMPL